MNLSSLQIWKKLKESLWHRKNLDSLLLATPKPEANLRLRIDWIEDLLQWIRSRGFTKHEFDFKTGAPQAARLRYLLLVLDRNPEWKSKVAALFRSVIKDTQGLELFIEIGLSSQDSFWAEFFNRLNEKILPQPPRTRELANLLLRNFKTEADVEWIRSIDIKTFTRIIHLFHFQESNLAPWNSLRKDIESAMLLLSHQIKGLGLGSLIRRRLNRTPFQELPFFQLPELIEKFLAEKDMDLKRVLSDKINKKIDACFMTLNEVHQHMDEYGVSVQIVFNIERMELILERLKNLNLLLQNETVNENLLFNFVEALISQNAESHSLKGLISENFSLLSRKISERTAETGEHYITRTKEEYLANIRKAFGGGFITSFTTLVKFLLYHLGLPSFHTGIAASLNYSVSFLILHFAHFTLGTKQPSMTAPALAARMHAIRNPEALNKLVDEIIDVIRSQVSSVLGNVIGVIPFTILIAYLWRFSFHTDLLSEAKAYEVLESFSVLGPTPIYAAFTGVLLWASSIFAGWVDNWFAYRQLTSALSHNRRLIFTLGEIRAHHLALFIKKNIAGISANVSLGFLLGLTPAILQFLGIPLDIRHVTLSSGSLAAAVTSFTAENFPFAAFWLAVGGIFMMAVMNILVAFFLALFVAIRARKVQAPERGLIYRAVLLRLRKNPLSLIWPRKVEAPNK